MKKFFIISLISLFLAVSSQADCNDARGKAVAAAYILANKGFTFKAVRGQTLKRKGYKTYSFYLYAGNQYAIIGVGDNGVKDLDVEIYDKNWNLKASDGGTSALTKVLFRVHKSGTYYVRTKIYSGSGCFAQVVGYR